MHPKILLRATCVFFKCVCITNITTNYECIKFKIKIRNANKDVYILKKQNKSRTNSKIDNIFKNPDNPQTRTTHIPICVRVSEAVLYYEIKFHK